MTIELPRATQIHLPRRDFLSCGAWLMVGLAMAPWSVRRAFAAAPTGDVITTKPFARVEKIADGVWAVVSTPWDSKDFTTMSNGGIIAGTDGVMVIEGFNTRAGGVWLSNLAKELTARWPTHLAVTHFHGDHTNGIGGCLHPDHEIEIISSAGTRRLLAERSDPKDVEFDPITHRAALMNQLVFPNTIIADGAKSTTIDLGGRVVTLEPRAGHTPSDVTIRIDNPRVMWCGDLVFNGLWPYFGDAIPSKLSANCKAMLTDPDTAYVPGHGSLATADELKNYIAVLDDLERAARDAFAKGIPASEAWKTYSVPASLGEWRKFRDNVYQFGFEAWERELKGS